MAKYIYLWFNAAPEIRTQKSFRNAGFQDQCFTIWANAAYIFANHKINFSYQWSISKNNPRKLLGCWNLFYNLQTILTGIEPISFGRQPNIITVILQNHCCRNLGNLIRKGKIAMKIIAINAKFYNLAKPVMGIEPISTTWKAVMITITPHRLKKQSE